jgi:hypothetical protein
MVAGVVALVMTLELASGMTLVVALAMVALVRPARAGPR